MVMPVVWAASKALSVDSLQPEAMFVVCTVTRNMWKPMILVPADSRASELLVQ